MSLPKLNLPKTVLVVDDEPDIVHLLRVCFEQQGYTVITAVNGREALDAVAVQKPDIILLDQMMPQVSGLEVAKKLKEDEATADIPVLLLTAKDSYDDMSKGWESGIDLYLVKPIDLQELKSFVQSILE
jgi:DNA-binding response OmpR family regulator